MILMLEEGAITGKIAKSVFEEMFRSGKRPADIVQELGLKPISGQDELGAVVEKVIAANPEAGGGLPRRQAGSDQVPGGAGNEGDPRPRGPCRPHRDLEVETGSERVEALTNPHPAVKTLVIDWRPA